MKVTYPDLPVSLRREEILKAMAESQIVVVVGETGSGKTTQLPKMALENQDARLEKTSGRPEGVQAGKPPKKKLRVGCTQPRRLAATSVARRVAEAFSTGDDVDRDEKVDELMDVFSRYGGLGR